MSDTSEEQSGGQVSEAESLQGDPSEPIEPDQSVGGAPDGESGSADEGPQGPNAVPEQNQEGPVSGESPEV